MDTTTSTLSTTASNMPAVADLPSILAKAPPVGYVLLLLLFIGIFNNVFKAVRNPLRKLPGPFYSNFTRLRLQWAVMTGQRIHYIQKLHNTYGSHVRISPTEVAVADPKSFSQIHKIGSGFTKPQWYNNVVNMDRPTTFTMSDVKQHAARRRLFARGFSKSYLRQNWESTVHEKVKLAVGRIKTDASAKPSDLMKWWILMATDVTVHLMFGESFHMVEKGELSDYVKVVQSGLKGNGIGVELPLVRAVLKHVPGELCHSLFRSNEEIGEYAKIAIENSKKEGIGSNIFSSINEVEKGDGFDDHDVVLEAIVLIVAGSDSTAVSLTFLVWAVLSHPSIQQDLESEVAALSANYSDSDLEALPVLNAVIQESMRLYGAANVTMPRQVPSGGATLSGYFLPEGTWATTLAHTIHRDSNLFPDPEKFDPSRWLSISQPAKAAYHPFGAGSRVCLGINLAQMELRLAVAEFFRECAGARLAPSVTAKSMELDNFFLLSPAGNKCEILLGVDTE